MQKVIFRYLVCFVICLPFTFLHTHKAQAQVGCSNGVASGLTFVYVGAPNVVFLIGNIIRVTGNPSKIWGITGIVTGATASIVQMLTMFIDLNPSCSDPIPPLIFNVAMLSIYSATIALGLANTIAADRMHAAKQKILHVQSQNKTKHQDLMGPSGQAGKLSCKSIFSLYRASLKDAKHSENKKEILQLVMRLERKYFPCFFTKREGRKLRFLRKKRLGSPAKTKVRQPTTRMPPSGKPTGSSTFSLQWNF